MMSKHYLESGFSGDLDGFLDRALASLKVQEPETVTANAKSKDVLLRAKLPKIQTGIDINSPYLKTNNQQLVAGVVLANNDVSSTSNKSNDDKALEQLEPAGMEDQPRISQRERRETREQTSGKSWFDMPKAKLTPELERDWQIIQMRNVLDPKRHYRKDKRKTPPTYCQVGTIIEGAAEFYSARMTRRERKQTILEEFLHDTDRRDYFRSRYRELQNERAKGTKAWRRAQRSKQK